jgi:penicillin-binding protein 1A
MATTCMPTGWCAHHHRFAPAGHGQPGRGAPGAASCRAWPTRPGPAQWLEPQATRAGAGTGARVAEYRAAWPRAQPPDEALQTLLADTASCALRQEKTRVQAGFMAMDPRTGHVLAWVGSRDFGRTRSTMCRPRAASRAPPSSPLCTAPRLTRGHAAHRHADGRGGGNPAGWPGVAPHRRRRAQRTPMTLADGLAFSKNTITAQLMQQVGPARVAELARAMGVRESKLEEVPSLALGTSPVTAQGNGGGLRHHRQRRPLRRACAHHPHRRQKRQGAGDFAQPRPSACLALQAAQHPARRHARHHRPGHGRGHPQPLRHPGRRGGQDRHHAGQHRRLVHPDAPALVAGAWVGFNDGRITLRSDYWGQGAHSALPMVGEVFQQACPR